MTVRTVLDAKPGGAALVAIAPDAPVIEAARLLSRHRIGALPVIDQGRLAGILSERDIVRGLARSVEMIRTARVRDLMTAEVFVCHPEDGLEPVLRLMSAKRIRHLPVIDGDKGVVGIVTLGDVAWARGQGEDCGI